MPENKALICKPVNSPCYVVPGSLPMKCHECDKTVWVSPAAMLILHDNPEMTILCEPCGRDCMAEHPGPIEPPTRAQIEEIKEYLTGRGVNNDLKA